MLSTMIQDWREMLPIEPLMTEHRLIERLIALMEKEGDKIKEDKLASKEHSSLITENPQKWMPWNYREMLSNTEE